MRQIAAQACVRLTQHLGWLETFNLADDDVSDVVGNRRR